MMHNSLGVPLAQISTSILQQRSDELNRLRTIDVMQRVVIVCEYDGFNGFLNKVLPRLEEIEQHLTTPEHFAIFAVFAPLISPHY